MSNNKRICAVIPSRYASVRFPGKPLALIKGKPMVQHVYDRAKEAKMIDHLLVATEDKRIFDAVKAFGGNAVMTSDKHNSGTDRIAEAVSNIDAEWVINIQGDEPLINADLIDKVAKALVDDNQVVMSTPITLLADMDELNNPNIVKTVIDKNGFALYFSRSYIPYQRDKNSPVTPVWYKHIGVYGYKKEFLLDIVKLPQSSLELAEQLEQLRVLENGFKIKTVMAEYNGIGVDTPSDIVEAERRL